MNKSLFLALNLGIFAGGVFAQNTVDPLSVFPKDRVPANVDYNQSISLRGQVRREARPELESGVVEKTMVLRQMIMTLQRDAEQKAALAAYADTQQDRTSPHFHEWLTNATYAEHFSVSKHDVDEVVKWLRASGFSIDSVSPTGWRITFTGTVSQVESAFHTQIRSYKDPRTGELHFANSTEPAIPKTFSEVITGVLGLHDYVAKTLSHAVPHYACEDCSGQSYYLSPNDFRTIYQAPVANSGTGVNIGIVARCAPDPSVVQLWLNQFFSATPAPNILTPTAASSLCTASGTTGSNNMLEVYLDAEWPYAVAYNATVNVYVAPTTEASAAAIVDANVADVVSSSFGACEPTDTLANDSLTTGPFAFLLDSTFWNEVWQEAVMKGMTPMVASGDSGVDGCASSATNASAGTDAKGVNASCSPIYVTCVGGTIFTGDASATQSNAGQYWSKDQATGYIPEGAWNESAISSSPVAAGLWSSGGGYSVLYPTPSWQVTANRTPNRGVPDVAFTAASHDAYVTCTDSSCFASLGAGCTFFQDCDLNFTGVEGTSAASPSFAGIMALVVKAAGRRQGNINPALYYLANVPGSGVFHDVTTGNNSVPGMTGYSAGPGWDPVTGLGSVSITALLQSWISTLNPIVALSTTAVSFGNVPVGSSSASTSVNFQNHGLPPLTITSITTNGANAADFTTTTTCPQPFGEMDSGASCQIVVTFKPTALGVRTAIVVISASGLNSPATITLTGTGAGAAVAPVISSINPASTTEGFPSDISLGVNGSNFTADDVVNFGTTKLTTTFVSSTALTAVLSHTLLTSSGTVPVTVTSASEGTSNAVNFTIGAPVNCTYSVSPPSASLQQVGGTMGFNISTQAGCAAFIVVDDTTWIHPSTTSIFGGGGLNLTVDPNNGPSARASVVGITNSAGALVASYPVTQTGYAATPTGLTFVSLPPCRILETRASQATPLQVGVFGPPAFTPGQMRTLIPSQSANCNIPAGASAYVTNVTSIPASAGKTNDVIIYPSDEEQPRDTTSGAPDGNIVANGAIIRGRSPDGAINVYSTDASDILIDVVGYFTNNRATSNLVFYPLTPCRVVDTRAATRGPGPFGGPAMAASETRQYAFPASPNCSIPSGAAAYSTTVTVAPNGQPLNFLTAWPGPSSVPRPVVSSLNSFDGRTVPNSAIIPAGSDGSIQIFTSNATDFFIDINGYFAADNGAGLSYYPVTQCTASSSADVLYAGVFGESYSGNTLSLVVPNSPFCAAIPSSAKGYAVDVTANPLGNILGYITLYPTGSTVPNVSMLNDFQKQVVTNSAIVPAGANGSIDVLTNGGPSNIQLMISGYFSR